MFLRCGMSAMRWAWYYEHQLTATHASEILYCLIVLEVLADSNRTTLVMVKPCLVTCDRVPSVYLLCLSVSFFLSLSLWMSWTLETEIHTASAFYNAQGPLSGLTSEHHPNREQLKHKKWDISLFRCFQYVPEVLLHSVFIFLKL